MERETEEKGGGGEGEKRGKGEGTIKLKCGEMVDGTVRYHERRVRECYGVTEWLMTPWLRRGRRGQVGVIQQF